MCGIIDTIYGMKVDIQENGIIRRASDGKFLGRLEGVKYEELKNENKNE